MKIINKPLLFKFNLHISDIILFSNGNTLIYLFNKDLNCVYCVPDIVLCSL